MIFKPSNLASGRREFLLNVLPAGSLFCLACGNLSAWTVDQETQKAIEKKHKFQEDSGMSFQEVFKFAYGDFIELMQTFANEIGREKLLGMLKRASEVSAKKEAEEYLKKQPNNDFATFRAEAKEKPDRFWEHVQTYTIVEDTDKAIEMRIIECLFAKTFREAGAADIGYAYCCYYDFPSAQAYNPKLKLILTKTLMQGDNCCNHRWVWEG